MYKEFFNYIATRIISYFEQECDNLHDGDRFCFKLDNRDLVEQVNVALKNITQEKEIQGDFFYQETYHTFTVKLANKEIRKLQYQVEHVLCQNQSLLCDKSRF